jgi:hypothetical protein
MATVVYVHLDPHIELQAHGRGPWQQRSGWCMACAGRWFECPVSVVPQVKFTQQNWHDRLTTILDDFPKVR